MEIGSLITGAAGGLLSGVTVAFFTYRLNLRKEHDGLIRQKAEDLYRAFDRYDKRLSGYYIQHVPLLRGQVDYNDHLDNIIQDGKQSSDAAAHAGLEVQMLVDFYFDDLKPGLTNYLTIRDDLNSVIADHRRAYKAGKLFDNTTEFASKLLALLMDLGRSSDKLKSAIVAEGVKYRPARRQLNEDAQASSSPSKPTEEAKSRNPAN